MRDYKVTAAELVNDFSVEMLGEYIRHLPEKGESWREMTPKELKRQLESCGCRIWGIGELLDIDQQRQNVRDELIDNAVLSMLLWYRLDKEPPSA